MSVTAIFKLGFLEGKRKIPAVVPQYLIPLHESLMRITSLGIGETTISESDIKVMVFEYKKRIGKRTFEYCFKELK